MKLFEQILINTFSEKYVLLISAKPCNCFKNVKFTLSIHYFADQDFYEKILSIHLLFHCHYHLLFSYTVLLASAAFLKGM